MDYRSVTVKGATLVVALEVLQEGKLLSQEQYAELLGRLPKEALDVVRGRMLPTDRIPLFVINELTVAGAMTLGIPVEDFGARLGRAGAEKGLGKWYLSIVAAIMKPQHLLARAPGFWKQLYSAGELTTIEHGAKSAAIELRNFPAHPASCGRATGWFETLARKANIRGCRVYHSMCMAKGAALCRWEISWDD